MIGVSMASRKLRNIALHTKSAPAQLAIQRLGDIELNCALTRNKDLGDDVFLAFLATADTLERIQLGKIAHGDTQIKEIMKDKRRKVRDSVFAVGVRQVSDDLAAKLIADPSFDSVQASMWLGADDASISINICRLLGLRANASQVLPLLAMPEIYDLDEAIKILLETNVYWPSELNKLMDTRPGFLPTLLEVLDGEKTSCIPRETLLNALAHRSHLLSSKQLATIIAEANQLHYSKRNKILTGLINSPFVNQDTLKTLVKTTSKSKVGVARLQEAAKRKADWIKQQANYSKPTQTGFTSATVQPLPLSPQKPENTAPVTILQDLELDNIYPDCWDAAYLTNGQQAMTRTIFEDRLVPAMSGQPQSTWDILISMIDTWELSLAELVNTTKACTDQAVR